jgi:hypothetical protein
MKNVWVGILILLNAVPVLPQASQRERRGLAIEHVNVIDVTGGPTRSDMTVVIAEGRIHQIGKSGEIRVPKNVQVIDAHDQFVIPGLWDMHVHIRNPKRDFPMYIVNGVVGVRNMAAPAKDIFVWRSDVALGRVLGPRIVACGPVIDGPNPARPDQAVSVHNADEARKAVSSLREQGADFIKVYDGIPREAYFAIADEAKKQHLPFVGHVPNEIRAIEASDAGQRSIEHLTGILPGASRVEAEAMKSSGDPAVIEEAMKTKNFSLIPQHIADLGNKVLDNYDEARAAELFRAFARNQTAQVPTLIVDKTRTFVDAISKEADLRLKYITESERNSWKPENNMFSRFRTPDYIAYRKRAYAKNLEVVRKMHDAGVVFLAGTDTGEAYTYPGFSLHDELGLLVEAGFTPLEALQSATRNPAMFLGVFDSQGSIEQGKIADLVLLEADPVKDIASLRKISAVIVGGRLIDKRQLRSMLENAESGGLSSH